MCPSFYNSEDHSNKKITLGIILILIGSLFFLNSIGLISFEVGKVIFSIPFFLFVVGILILINSSKKVLGGILSGVGIIFLIPKIFPWINYGPNLIWPVLLISLGIYIIFKHTQKKSPDYQYTEEKIDKDIIEDVAIFGGGQKIVTTENFKGGSITAIFGGSEIDLRNCKMAEGNNVIDIVAIFGGTTLIIPNNWNIQINITPIFGGFSNKTFKSPSSPIDYSRTLVLKGLCLFGGGEIKSV